MDKNPPAGDTPKCIKPVSGFTLGNLWVNQGCD